MVKMFLQLHQYANDWKWQLKASVNSKIDRWCTFVITSLKFVHIFHEKKTRSVSGVMVSIVAFQAVDRGSIPRWRSFVFSLLKIILMEEKSVRSGIRTHAHISGPEISRSYWDLRNDFLESGALDHSAILTCFNLVKMNDQILY